MATKYLTQTNFKQEIEKGYVLVDFFASWCGPCRMLAPIFEELSEEFTGKVKFAKVSTEEEPMLSSKYRIQSIPCMILFKDGQEFHRFIGFASKNQLRESLNKVLQ
ncbi:thioredoxin [Candidatus Woesearchaeota archaeon]|nr:thioredoxin [Candidatus Woesearchaeota archaeon]